MEPRRKRLAVAAVVIAIALVLVSASAWYAFLRPLTFQEVMDYPSWRAGDVRDLTGTITKVQRLNTSYGPQVWLQLDGTSNSCVYGDPNGTYRVGERFQTTMHFTDYHLNGDPAVWAPELCLPMPEFYTSIAEVFDAVSMHAGVLLAYNRTDASGWSSYSVLTANGDAYPLGLLNASLREGTSFQGTPVRIPIDSGAAWEAAASAEYVSLSGGFRDRPEVDRIDNLAGGASVNGTLRFVDANSDGLLDDWDLVQVRLPSVSGEHASRTYLLSVGAFGYPSLATGGKVILQGPQGPYDLRFSSVDWSTVRFRHVGEVLGPTVTSTVEVRDVILGSPAPSAAYGFTLWQGNRHVQGNVSSPPPTTDGITVTYQDRNGNGLLDAGDRMVFQGLTNRSAVSLDVSKPSNLEGSFTWIAGYGHIVGNLPQFTLTAGAGPPNTIRADVPWWHPELALGRPTLTVSLTENATVLLDNATLTDGTFPGGSLTFTDANFDGYLSTGDTFVLQGVPGARYRLEVSLLWGYVSSSVDVGP